ncbi:hypothetical protein BKI52_20495 [marine bacterium AO1-C]|nr:hypothetical protein BKI52_20495 [marine bacterium AO1-C]
MKTRKTPQEKKRLSYLKDCRNAYGESDKGSRTSIRFRKRYVNKAYRKTIRQNLLAKGELHDEQVVDDIQNKVLAVKRKFWQKAEDMPLGEYIQQRRSYRRQQGKIASSVH